MVEQLAQHRIDARPALSCQKVVELAVDEIPSVPLVGGSKMGHLRECSLHPGDLGTLEAWDRESHRERLKRQTRRIELLEVCERDACDLQASVGLRNDEALALQHPKHLA